MFSCDGEKVGLYLTELPWVRRMVRFSWLQHVSKQVFAPISVRYKMGPTRRDKKRKIYPSFKGAKTSPLESKIGLLMY